MQSFSSWYGKDEIEEVFGEDSEYDENRKVRSCFIFKVENFDLLQKDERKALSSSQASLVRRTTNGLSHLG